VKIPNWVKWVTLGVVAYCIATAPAGTGHFISSSVHNVGVFFSSIHP
jgi:hypothetical protein